MTFVPPGRAVRLYFCVHFTRNFEKGNKNDVLYDVSFSDGRLGRARLTASDIIHSVLSFKSWWPRLQNSHRTLSNHSADITHLVTPQRKGKMMMAIRKRKREMVSIQSTGRRITPYYSRIQLKYIITIITIITTSNIVNSNIVLSSFEW